MIANVFNPRLAMNCVHNNIKINLRLQPNLFCQNALQCSMRKVVARNYKTGKVLTSAQVEQTENGHKRITIVRPDDWHLHVRADATLQAVVPHTARVFGRAIIMPNLRPPVRTAKQAIDYRRQILDAVPSDSSFSPLMTLYLTETTTPEDVKEAVDSGIVAAFKLYPAGATTNSDAGVKDILNCMDTLGAMAELGLPLLVHGEVADQTVDIFDREQYFLNEQLAPLQAKLPKLKVVLEHATTADAVEYVKSGGDNIACTITPQHLLFNRGALFQGGLQPHMYCLPILKRERHRLALVEAATSGNEKFFLGTDSAPHPKNAKECACGCAGIFSAHAALPLYAHVFDQVDALENLEAFASKNGPKYYGREINKGTVTLEKIDWLVPAEYNLGAGNVVVPLWAEQILPWKVIDVSD